MSCIKFKLTTVAALVLAATQANAALYDVVEVTSPIGGNEVYGVAIQDATVSGTESCFTTNTVGTVACSSFKLAGETRNSVEGVSYREEVPFAMDNAFRYIQEWADFESYCITELRYSTCSSWATKRWDTWALEINNLASVNAKAFVEGGASYTATNSVINSLDSSGGANTAVAVGNQSNGSTSRNVSFSPVANTDVIDVSDLTVRSESRAWKTNGTFTVGSISKQVSNENGAHNSSKASIWSAGSGSSSLKQLDWNGGVENKDNVYLGQGSLRSFTINGDDLYAVGYNTYTDQHMNASIFKATLDNGAPADLSLATFENSQLISGTEVKVGGDFIHNNSVATDINDNLFVIGTAQRDGDKPENGAVNNRIFVVPDASDATPSATFLSGGIFFAGAGGKAGAVNNFNEIVGQIDADTNREVDGKQRRHRGFINPYQATGTDATRRALFKNQAWWLDDLTNDGNVSGTNNHFRIIDATDINDAGVISATAIKCSVGPYDTTSHNSYCGGGSAAENVVAVKLVPKSGAKSADIQPRSYDTQTVERSGGSLGIFALTLLGLLGFRRK